MSKTIHNPTLADIISHSDTSATFVIEPLHTGYGMTLGNSLRRVLLSSIAGSAITAFRVDGASHEFTTIPGIKEDVIDIMLNLKGVNTKSYSDESVIVRLEKKGGGIVTAGDIKATSDVEIVNPEHIIATIDDPKGSLAMDIVIEVGRGYVTTEQSRAHNQQAEMIVVDAFFNPVKRVRYKVEDTRVGQTTDLDKLLITIDTDGTITPQEAFEEAAAILVNQYTALAGKTTVESGKPLSEASPSDNDGSKLMTPIEDLNLSARTTNALLNNDIRTISDLVTINDSDLREMKGFGAKALDEVRDKLAEMEF